MKQYTNRNSGGRSDWCVSLDPTTWTFVLCKSGVEETTIKYLKNCFYCKKWFDGFCVKHPLIFVQETLPVAMPYNCDITVPEFLKISHSSMAGGKGVFACSDLPRGLTFGPYAIGSFDEFIVPLIYVRDAMNGFPYSSVLYNPYSSNAFHHLLKRRLEKGRNNDDEDCPKPKMRITEDKIAARLKNFHISHDYSQKSIGEKCHETFEEIENRLSSDDEDLDLDVEQPESSEKVIQVSKELKDLVKNKLDERLLLLPPSVPNICTAVVLWQPSPWENLLPKPQRKELLEKLANSEQLTRIEDEESKVEVDPNAMDID